MLRSLLAPALILGAVGLAASLFVPLPQPAAVSVPAAIALAALLLMPAIAGDTRSDGRVLRQSAIWSAVTGLIAALAVGVTSPASSVIAASVSTVLVIMAGSALWWLMERNTPHSARWRFATLLLLTSSAPLWAAPLAELHAPLATVVACASPLSLLSVLMDHDYLRTAFFYQHSALGALSYRYPSAGVFAGAYAVAAAVLWTTALGVKTRSENQP